MFVEELTKLRMAEENQKRKGLLTPTIENKASICVYEIFKSNDKKENSINLKKWINTATSSTLAYICEIMEYIERGYGRIGNSSNLDYRFIEEESIGDIERHLLRKIKELSKKSCLYDYDGIQEICLLWEFLEKESLDEYTRSLLKEDANIPKYLERISLYWHSSNGTDGWSFNEESFEGYINKDDAFARISKLKNSKEFSALAPKFKQSAIAFFLWYQKEGEAKAHITREEVNTLMSAWECVEKSEK